MAGDVTNYTRGDADLTDTQGIHAMGGKPPIDNQSEAVTNYTKNRQSGVNYNLGESSEAGYQAESKRNKKTKGLPRIYDERRVTPKGRMQYSTDFSKKKKRGAYGFAGDNVH